MHDNPEYCRDTIYLLYWFVAVFTGILPLSVTEEDGDVQAPVPVSKQCRRGWGSIVFYV